MPDGRTIIAKFDAAGGQFVAHFDGDPCHVYGGDLPAVAVRRLLEGDEAEPGGYLLLCDADLIGSDTLRLEIEWKPRALFLPCQA